MANLYEIDQEIMSCVDQETGEILDIERLENLHMERDQKVENLALWYKNTLSDIEAYKREKDSFAKKLEAAKKKSEGIKGYLSYALGGSPFKTSRVTISYRKSTSVQIEDEEFFKEKHPELCETEIVTKIPKTRIGDLLKAGVNVEGAALEEKQNLQIK